MNARKSLISLSMLALTACATPMPQVLDCGSPPRLPEAVQSQADQQRPTYYERGSSLLRFFETLIETGQR